MGRNKQRGICHICGDNCVLSFEHIPPKKAFNDTGAKVYNGKELLEKYRGLKVKYLNLQQGMGRYTLCDKCNNNTGAWYANEYCEVANKVVASLNSEPLYHGYVIDIALNDIAVLPFIKQVITMFCSLIPYESVVQLGFDKLISEKENNKVNTELFDIRMYLTPIKTGQLSSGIVGVLIKNEFNGVDYAKIVDLATYPFGFILNLSPEIELKYGTSINSFLKCTYNEKRNLELSLTYIERLNEDVPLPMVFKPLPN